MKNKKKNYRRYCPLRKKSKTAYDKSIRSPVRVPPYGGNPRGNVKTIRTPATAARPRTHTAPPTATAHLTAPTRWSR